MSTASVRRTDAAPASRLDACQAAAASASSVCVGFVGSSASPTRYAATVLNPTALAAAASSAPGSRSRKSAPDAASAITDSASFYAANAVEGPDPQPAGSAETVEVAGLTYNTFYYFALRALDEFGNAGPISNVATGTTLGIPNISVTPASLSETLLTGAQATQQLTIQNTGEGRLDWTAGCIAVSDREMEEIWSMVPTGIPITILA